ncbi:uncharacterized protein ppp1r3f isoform X2 [Denticeps clupeoides]|nr:protein phosphatase 1 regulatory subunit 3F isoform X2 [Denticeps clupeoides]
MSRAHAAPEPECLSSRAAAELPLHKPIAIMPQDSQRLVQASQTLLPSELGCILLIQEVKDSSVCVASSTSGNVDAKTALDTIFEPILSHERATCDPDPVVATEVPSQPTLTSSSFPPSTLDVAREEKTFLEDVRKEQGMDPKETQKMTDESQMQVTKSTLAVRSDNQLLGFGAETSMSDVLDAKEKYDVRGVEDHSLKAGLETNSEDKTEVLLTTEKIHVPWLMPIQDTIPLGSAVESRTAQNLPILGPTFEIPVLQRCFNPNLVSESHKLNEHLPEGASASSNCPDVDRAESSFSEDKTREQWMDPNEPQEMTQETENTTTVRYDNTFLGFNVGSSLSDVLDETQKLDVSGVKDPCLTAGQEIDSENQTDGQTIRLVPTLVTISVGSTTEARMTQNLTVLGPSFETPVLQTHFSQDLLSGDMQNVTSLIKALSENNDVDEDFDVEQGSCHEVSKLGYELPANSEGSKEQTPCNLSRGPEIPGSQSEAIERRPLIPTFAFTLITVCLVVGFQEPNALLLIGLFLFSLYF